MKKQLDIKKLVLLNLPYLLMGLFATNFGEAWRLAQGANASDRKSTRLNSSHRSLARMPSSA